MMTIITTITISNLRTIETMIILLTMVTMTTMMTISTMMTILTMITILSMMTILIMMTISTVVFVKKLEVAHKQVRDYLIPYVLQPTWRLSDQMRAYCRVDHSEWWMVTQSVSQSVPYVGIKLLGQLKIAQMKSLPKNSKEATVSKLNEMQFKNLFDHPLSLISYRTGLHCAKSRVFGANRSVVGRANSKKIARECLQRPRVFSTVPVSSMSVVISATLVSLPCNSWLSCLYCLSCLSNHFCLLYLSSFSCLSSLLCPVSPVSTVCSFYLRTMIYRTRCIVSDGYPTMIVYLVDVRW